MASRENARFILKCALPCLLVLAFVLAASTSALATQMSGAIFTTDINCSDVNKNIYESKMDVYLIGGPDTVQGGRQPAGLPEGYYYVQVTLPNDRTLLGTSVGSSNPTPIHVSASGTFDQCYQLWSIVVKASDASQGYDDTTNNGGEYKVWVSTSSSFVNSDSKTDNFKVRAPSEPPEFASLHVIKFYDANANGINDDSQPLTGWSVTIGCTSHQLGWVDMNRCTPVDATLAPGTYTVTENRPIETNWMATTPTLIEGIVLAGGDNRTAEFGNLCLGPGGGLTLGYWSNKNGQMTMNLGGMAAELAFLTSLNLRNASGANFDPTSYPTFRSWLLNATATNMAYMLSAQLAAMELNVLNGRVSPSALVYMPGAQSANSLGFGTVSALMAEANAELGLHGYTPDGSPYRSYQEALKNALDMANNDRTFVQATACPYSFANSCIAQ